MLAGRGLIVLQEAAYHAERRAAGCFPLNSTLVMPSLRVFAYGPVEPKKRAIGSIWAAAKGLLPALICRDHKATVREHAFGKKGHFESPLS